jgi:hypothetical protein
VQKLFTEYSTTAGIQACSVHALRHSMAVHLLEAARGIENVADHLGHQNIQHTCIYAQITNPLREQMFRELAQCAIGGMAIPTDVGATAPRRPCCRRFTPHEGIRHACTLV